VQTPSAGGSKMGHLARLLSASEATISAWPTPPSTGTGEDWPPAPVHRRHQPYYVLARALSQVRRPRGLHLFQAGVAQRVATGAVAVTVGPSSARSGRPGRRSRSERVWNGVTGMTGGLRGAWGRHTSFTTDTLACVPRPGLDEHGRFGDSQLECATGSGRALLAACVLGLTMPGPRPGSRRAAGA
jgi:hypothetical protein